MPVAFGARSVGWDRVCSRDVSDRVRKLPRKDRLGVSRFFAWLADNASDDRVARIARLLNLKDDDATVAPYVDSLHHEREFVDALRAWRDEHLNGSDESLSRVTRAQDVASGMQGLLSLRAGGCRAVPRGFISRMVTVGAARGDGWPTLGEASWPELDGLTGVERERQALQLVRDAFLSMFLQGERLFTFGQSLLRNDAPPPGTDPTARASVRDSLLRFRAHVREAGSFKIASSTLRQRLERDPETWMKAGAIDIRTLWDAQACVALAHRGCLGPLGPTMMGALGVFLCDTGWNLQPTRDLPRNPYVFSSSVDAFVAERSFVESFKRRAGHHVLAYLGEPGVSEHAKRSVAAEHWRATIEECDARNECDGYAVLDREQHASGPSAADVLERYRVIAEALRAEFGDRAERLLGDGLWVYCTNRPLPRSLASFSPNSGPTAGGSDFFPEGAVLARPGFSFRSIRKTWLVLRRHDTGSFAATRVAAGHVSTSVLMPHYLNTPTVNAELDASIRQFQDAMEAIVVRDLDQDAVALTLGKDVADLSRLRKVADKAGITATLGLSGGDHPGGGKAPTSLRFRPDDERLFELFLLHRKLREMQSAETNRARFRQNHLPLLALCKAIGREVFRNHLGPRYWRAARDASAALKAGKVALPCVED